MIAVDIVNIGITKNMEIIKREPMSVIICFEKYIKIFDDNR